MNLSDGDDHQKFLENAQWDILDSQERSILARFCPNDLVPGRPCTSGSWNGQKPGQENLRGPISWFGYAEYQHRQHLYKAHKARAGAKKEKSWPSPEVNDLNERFEKDQYIGGTHCGRNTKIHAIVDALGNLIYVQLSTGDIHDSAIEEDVLRHQSERNNSPGW